MAELTADGITVDLPVGWDGEIYRRTPDAAFDQDLAPEAEGETVGAVLHIANFPMPKGRGDFGSGAVEIMRRQDLLIVLFEYDRASADTVLFGNKLRLPISADDFDPNRLQRPLPGQGGVQVFFNASGRAFCLYIVVGSFRLRAPLVQHANEVLRSLKLS